MLVVFAKRLKTNLHPSIALHICTYSKLSVIIVPKSNRYAIKNLYQYYQNGLNILHQPIVFYVFSFTSFDSIFSIFALKLIFKNCYSSSSAASLKVLFSFIPVLGRTRHVQIFFLNLFVNG